MAYRTVAGKGEVEEVVRNSRFIAVAHAVAHEEEFARLLEGVRSLHSAANHHCWAFRAGEQMRFDDDGEPGGTAGRPILEVLLKRDLDHVGIIVTRYFGGTRLGAGGLARAYGGTAAKALDAAGERLIEDKSRFEIMVPFHYVDLLHRLIGDTRGARVLRDDYGPDGWRLSLELPLSESSAFRDRLSDSTRGEAQISE